MPRTVAEGFDRLLSRIPATDTVTETTRRHRDSIEVCLRANFSVEAFMAVGSFGHGTNIPLYSDVDYFMVTPDDELSASSPKALRQVKDALAKRFWATDVRVSTPAVVVPFGHSSTERFEITPAFADDEEEGVFWIPDRASDQWMLAAPKMHKAYVNDVNDRLNKRPKRLIRLVKLWSALSGTRLRSIYLELRIAKGLREIGRVDYSTEFAAVLRRLYRTELAAMRDPTGYTGLISPCSEARKSEVLTKIARAIGRADKALAAEAEGDMRTAFSWWNAVFKDKFPRYRHQ